MPSTLRSVTSAESRAARFHLREFTLTDPNGNNIRIGQGV